MIDIDKTIIRQYFTSPRMRRILTDFANNLDGKPFVDLLTENVLDPRTATGWGLDVWGRIVGVSRYLKIAHDKFFGFMGGDSSVSDTFNNAIWYNGEDISGSAILLSDEMMRRMIFAKAWSNISDCSVRSINGALNILFGEKNRVYVRDNLDKTLTIMIKETDDNLILSVIVNGGVLPIPAGVSYAYEVTS